ncbi:hypothetical protein [Aurantimonas coralicida]|uniref:hypothetical protein n=1 Tax=Aurantimonas coralicida TaxID=182270 RepID=UPI001E483875|nr:hypothetical protein [Aurantimonas coralicida]MCD1645274.1 hypothetical protein [Aurantimonas coralicida]
MMIEQMKTRARARLSQIEGNIAAVEASLGTLHQQAHRHEQFLEWLESGDEAMLTELAAEPTPEPAPVDEPAVGPVAGGDDGAEGTAAVAEAEAGPVRDDPVPADRTDGDPVSAAGDDVPADAEVGDDRGKEASGAGEAGKEAHAPAQSPMDERLVPRLTVTPEAEGLTEYDQRFLDVMRMNLDRHGLCKLKPFDICEIADLNKATAGSCISRLIKARRIVHSSGGAYRVSDKGGSFPPMQKAETPAVPPARPKVVSALADQLLQKFADVAAKKNTDTVMFGREFLIEFAGAAKGDFLPVDQALAELGSRRVIEVTHRDKMNVTVRVLPIAEAAE